MLNIKKDHPYECERLKNLGNCILADFVLFREYALATNLKNLSYDNFLEWIWKPSSYEDKGKGSPKYNDMISGFDWFLEEYGLKDKN